MPSGTPVVVTTPALPRIDVGSETVLSSTRLSSSMREVWPPTPTVLLRRAGTAPSRCPSRYPNGLVRLITCATAGTAVERAAGPRDDDAGSADRKVGRVPARDPDDARASARVVTAPSLRLLELTSVALSSQHEWRHAESPF
jgi:hypothetical protein